MIGVVAREDDHEVVREFFELFKTPWEFYHPGKSYEVILAPANQAPPRGTGFRILHGSKPDPIVDGGLESVRKESVILTLEQGSLSIHGACLLFQTRSKRHKIQADGAIAIMESSVRLGYDFFEEIRTLLVQGQPERHAQIPTLDLHVDLIRQLIVKAGVALVEIPPLPAGHPFSVCLTHDIDHPVLRNHRFDHTAFGFLRRATLGALKNFFSGRISARELCRNWSAALRYPLVQLGLAADPWSGFDRYMEIEKDLASTFFVIPRPGCPGSKPLSANPSRRASSYSLKDIEPQLQRILQQGGEIALHGIDAWNSEAAGRLELGLLKGTPAAHSKGVRMHWLWFDKSSPEVLERAGFSYDSTIGYNSTVGYRAGTMQVFRPLGTMHLLELPLHIMDTALFYPGHLDLSREEAAKLVRRFFCDAKRFGGVLTINWHDRSIAPERQWGDFYIGMLKELKQLNPWFATASAATTWFRLRRSVEFEEIRSNGIVVKVKVRIPAPPESTKLPGFRLRVTQINPSHTDTPDSDFAEQEFRESAELKFSHRSLPSFSAVSIDS